jgi:hypothetical protein
MIISCISFRDEDGDYLNFSDVDKETIRMDVNEKDAIYFSLKQWEEILAKLREVQRQNLRKK